MLKMILASAAVALVAPALAQDDAVPPLLAEALARPAGDPDMWTFTRATRIKAVNEDCRIRETFDPTLEKAARLKVDKHCVDAEGKADPDPDPDGDVMSFDLPTYDELGEMIENGVELVREDDDEAVYRAKRGPSSKFSFGTISFSTGDVEDDVATELTIAKRGSHAPYVKAVHAKLDEPKGLFVARIRDLNFHYSFAPEGPDGEMLPRDFNMLLNMTALFFIDIDVDIASEVEYGRRVEK